MSVNRTKKWVGSFPLSGVVFCSSQCFTTGVTKAIVCTVLSGDGAYKISLAANRKE